jgi:protein-disulfide isomerase
VPVPVSSEGAAVLIVRFSDYQCPSCGQTYLGYKPLFERYSAQHPGMIKLVVKDFPLQTECNPNVSRDVHLASCAAAAAARMARAKGRGDAMEEWLYTNQATLTPASVRDAARQVAGVTDFDAQYPAVLNQVKTDVALAAVLGIRVTPTFFICSRKPGESDVTGIKLEGGLPPQYFELAIQQELKRAGKTP